jgi:hypothetical protein
MKGLVSAFRTYQKLSQPSAIEGVMRRDSSMAFKERVVQVGFVFLLAIMACSGQSRLLVSAIRSSSVGRGEITSQG